MKPLSAFYPRILPYVVGCPEPLAAQALVDQAIAFCEDSMALRRRLDPFQTESGVAQYSLDAEPQQQIARVLSVLIDGYPIQLYPTNAPIPVVEVSAKPTVAYTTREDGGLELLLYPTPDRAYTVNVEVALRPVRGATQLADDLLDLWADPVCLGAVGTLALTPGQPFSDPALGTAMSARALQLSRKARIEGSIGRVRASHRVSPRPFA